MLSRTTILVAMMLFGVIVVPAQADDLLPVVVASIEDNPRDGLGDSFADPFAGLLREGNMRENRAVLEYDVSAFAGETVTATVAGIVRVNNGNDQGERTFDLLLYDANGVADLSDFEIPATVVGSISYQPPIDTMVDFSVDVTNVVQQLLDGGATFIGLKVDCTSDPNPPNLLDPGALTIELPEPGTGLLQAAAMLVLAYFRKGRALLPRRSF